MSPDNGKTRLNPTNAHTQGVSGAAGLLFKRGHIKGLTASHLGGVLNTALKRRHEGLDHKGWTTSKQRATTKYTCARADRGPTRSQQRRSTAAKAPLTRGPIRSRRPSRSRAVRDHAARSPLRALHRSQHADHQQQRWMASPAAGRGRRPPERVGTLFLRRHACSCAPWWIHALRGTFLTGLFLPGPDRACWRSPSA